MTAESQQVSYAGYSSSEQWAEDRLHERRSGASQKAYNRPPTAEAEKRSSWWPVFWLLCLIGITGLMILRQASTTPDVALSGLRASLAAQFSTTTTTTIFSPSSNSIDQANEQSLTAQGQPDQQEDGPLTTLRNAVGSLLQPLNHSINNLFGANDTPAAAGPRIIVADASLEPFVSLASASVTERWVMDFLPDESNVYRMRVWPDSLAWTSLGGVAIPERFRLETAMQVNPLVPQGYGGFLARYQDEDNYYIFVVDGDGNYQAALRQDGGWTILQPWTNKPAIQLAGNGENALMLEDTQDLIRVYANGALLGEIEPTLPAGLMGFASGTRSTQTAEVDYSGLTLYELP